MNDTLPTPTKNGVFYSVTALSNLVGGYPNVDNCSELFGFPCSCEVVQGGYFVRAI